MLSLSSYDFLKIFSIFLLSLPMLALAAIHNNELFHAISQTKEAKDATLTIDEIKQIPEKFVNKDTIWFYDTKEKML